MSTAICAIAKNENLYLKEWVEYHKNIGINKIFIYDNNGLTSEKYNISVYVSDFEGGLSP